MSSNNWALASSAIGGRSITVTTACAYPDGADEEGVNAPNDQSIRCFGLGLYRNFNHIRVRSFVLNGAPPSQEVLVFWE
jgi:hypothetical protein